MSSRIRSSKTLAVGLVVSVCLLGSDVASAQEIPLERRGAVAKQEIEKAKKQIAEAEAGIKRSEAILERAQSLPQTPDNVKAQDVLRQSIRNHQETILRARKSMQLSQEKLALLREQEEFERMNAAWVRKQQEWIRQAVERDKRWGNEVLSSLRELRPPNPDYRPKTLNDLSSGDIVLLAPGDYEFSGHLITLVDDLITGRLFKPGESAAYASHALAFLGRDASGRMLFLDHTAFNPLKPEEGGGSHIIGETEFQQKYGHRQIYVARPQTAVHGRKLLETALEAVKKTKEGRIVGTDYGLLGKNEAVCSERAAFAVVKATGLPYETRGKLHPIDITPGDFFDNEKIGKYFIVTPLQK